MNRERPKLTSREGVEYNLHDINEFLTDIACNEGYEEYLIAQERIQQYVTLHKKALLKYASREEITTLTSTTL